jgi:hypothetical protein
MKRFLLHWIGIYAARQHEIFIYPLTYNELIIHISRCILIRFGLGADGDPEGSQDPRFHGKISSRIFRKFSLF